MKHLDDILPGNTGSGLVIAEKKDFAFQYISNLFYTVDFNEAKQSAFICIEQN